MDGRWLALQDGTKEIEDTLKRSLELLRLREKIKLDGEWRLIKINPAVERLLGTLDLLPKADKLPVRGVGRPRKAIV